MNENYPLDHQDMLLFSIFKDPIADLLISSKEENFHDYQEPLVSLFQSSVKVEFLSFISSSYGFNFYSELLIYGPLKNSQEA